VSVLAGLAPLFLLFGVTPCLKLGIRQRIFVSLFFFSTSLYVRIDYLSNPEFPLGPYSTLLLLGRRRILELLLGDILNATVTMVHASPSADASLETPFSYDSLGLMTSLYETVNNLSGWSICLYLILLAVAYDQCMY
jgi:hypothetical protein